MQKLCQSFQGLPETFPFGTKTPVFKVAGKMFALSQLAEHPLRVSLKCEPQLAEQQRATWFRLLRIAHCSTRSPAASSAPSKAKGALARDEPGRVAHGDHVLHVSGSSTDRPARSRFGSAGHHVLRFGHKRGRSRQ